MSGKDCMLGAGVEVWTARPDRLGCEGCAHLQAVLDDEERDRVARLRCEEDRRSFVVAHAMRRIALGLALSVDPSDLRFSRGPHGQPLLVDAPAHAPQFSLSRSRGLVAVALAAGEVGIDVEAIRDGVDAALLQPYYSIEPGEVADDESFYVHWTALEAYWKARGLGLSTGHPRLRLDPVADDCWSVLHAPDRAAGLVVMRLPCDPTHVLALACEGVMDVRIIELDALAQAPQQSAMPTPSECTNRLCEIAGANPFNA